MTENLGEDQQDKDSESNSSCVKCDSFSPNSTVRAGNRQHLLGALGRSQCPVSGPSKGTGPAPRLRKDPTTAASHQHPMAMGQGGT